MNTLTFNEVDFNPVERNGQIWLTSIDLAKALGYKSTKSVSNLYSNNSDEFTDQMTLVIELMTNGIGGSKRKMSVRIFSLRGCHAIGFFARTKIAKQFRKWVLDILDKEVGAPVQVNILSTVADRKYLNEAVNFYCAKTGSIQSEIWKMVHHRFNIEGVHEMTLEQVPLAVEYVHGFILQAKQVKGVEVDGNNEFWRYVGVIKYQELTQVLTHAKSVAASLEEAISHAQIHTGLIFDAFDGQHRQSGLGKSGHHEAYIKAKAFAERQTELKRALRIGVDI